MGVHVMALKKKIEVEVEVTPLGLADEFLKTE